MVVRLTLVLAALASFVLACGDGHVHLHAKRDSRWLISSPSRPLQWGELNVIHTTDTHGWLLGHQEQSPPEPNYSGTFGEFADFVQHMKEIALKKDVDLLLIDSGDVHDGTGLSDGFPVGGTDAHESNQFIKQLPYDLLAIGNHELYIYNNTLDMYTDFVPHWNGRYLSSNVNITIPDPSNPSQNISVPIGSRHVKFKTRLGRRVTSLGVLFDFTGNDDGTTVQRVEDMVKEQWFTDAIAEEPDLFLLVGHMPVSEDNWPTVFNAVRAVHPTTPILIFGGHAHVRDCVQFDGRSMALASGRYMETVGWMSVDFDKKEPSRNKNLTFSRRYLDANRLTYEFHAGRNNHTFDTSYGQSITRGLEDLAVRFDLNFTYGTAPQDYTISRNPYPSNGSSLTLFVSQAIPVALGINNTRSSQGDGSTTSPALFIANSGSQRFDIFKGPFTKNDQLTASPFTDAFLYLGNVSYGIAKQVLGLLNEEGGEVSKIKREARRGEKRWREELYRRGEVEMVYKKWLGEMYAKAREMELQRRDGNSTVDASTMGYVTSDSCPGIGDDTPHTPLPFYSSPAYISSTDFPSVSSSNLTSISDDTPIDLVFVDFIASDVLEILNDLETEEGSGRNFTEGDVASYSELLADEVLGVFAQQEWKINKSGHGNFFFLILGPLRVRVMCRIPNEDSHLIELTLPAAPRRPLSFLPTTIISVAMMASSSWFSNSTPIARTIRISGVIGILSLGAFHLATHLTVPLKRSNLQSRFPRCVHEAGFSLSRSKESGNREDLDSAISFQQAALDSCPRDHSDLGAASHILAHLLYMRYER